MTPPSLLVHGYGVRGYFWHALHTTMTNEGSTVEAPDIDLPTVEGRVEWVRKRAVALSSHYSGPIAIIGHSLGGVLAALAVRDLPRSTVSHLVIIASPFGNRVGRAFGPMIRIRAALGLVSRKEIQDRFFGEDVSPECRRWVHAQAPNESQALRALARSKRWFHTDEFPNGVCQKVLAIASDADRIVASEETREFAIALNAGFVCFPKEDRIGHNDFGVYSPVAERTAQVILPFLQE